jgi:hypothetical protein
MWQGRLRHRFVWALYSLPSGHCLEGLRLEGLRLEGLRLEGLRLEGLRLEGRVRRRRKKSLF